MKNKKDINSANIKLQRQKMEESLGKTGESIDKKI